MVVAGHGHPPLLHRLQQCRLGARARPVDLVRHQQLAEHGPRDEPEAAPSGLGLLHHLRAENVGRHQVRRELHALLAEPEHHAQGLDQPGLGEARHADQQHVAAGQQRGQRFLDHLLLAEDRPADFVAHPAEAFDRGLDLVEDRRIIVHRSFPEEAYKLRAIWRWRIQAPTDMA